MIGSSIAAPRILGLASTHAAAVLDLYRAAASVEGAGLALAPDEMTIGYVEAFLDRAAHGGITLGALIEEGLVATSAAPMSSSSFRPFGCSPPLQRDCRSAPAAHPRHSGAGCGDFKE